MARIGLENIIMSFGTNGKRSTILEDINLQVNDGDFVSLIGPSGCGKSTLLDLVAGLKKPTSGRILIDGQEILGPGPDRGVVFQDYSLFPWMSALENVCFAIEHSHEKLSKAEALARAIRYLEVVGLSKLVDVSDEKRMHLLLVSLLKPLRRHAGAGASLCSSRDDLIGDILQVEHARALVLEVACHHIEGDVGSGMTDMRIIINSGTADK